MKYRHGISSLLLCETDKLEKPGFKVVEISQCLTMTASQPQRERRPPARQEAATMANEVNRIAELLLDAWQKADPKSSVALHPVSYVATFADMAKAIIEDRNTRPAAPVEGLERYDLEDQSQFNEGCYMRPDETGEYVRYEKAEAIIAAKDVLLHISKQWAQDQENRANRLQADNAALTARVARDDAAFQELIKLGKEADTKFEALETQLAAARKALERVVKYSSPQSQASLIARAALEVKL